ncbi:hypothetical protein A3D81_00205 [Candidatus Curtissbacteria bacterium RIFCSPHIGHO2_02_FULL_40_17]|uniref:Uncharacterized protein n=4 Tax=Candidatus Curtissiibacteriota TaxID=1752717 RepID=A0A1F5GGC9_9BACT|nr:MAG: hypothetical protein A2693_02000 [Candidatus Curtissbacteria bacterium RIFCSPHIGHO2_01_FULL_40_12]OGD90914.1 MAG: hypothetical protein A3D81_00205 [Candidatus Curtissbacteria bacterium RIFCSPHIGHO2_02_FULL_40_17]OGE04870.1 MAG: hypothetical protein A3F45_01385 [Candidatus Curtissbacteria bacterium RIFCSPHIGHO2_12_FULL_41_17]OGE06826.1 MAG: hypothetical protein A3I53_01395 [Candidatus Curtissbacteria bacterium RIFCSPLOWO2_02_FULL_40_13b]
MIKINVKKMERGSNQGKTSLEGEELEEPKKIEPVYFPSFVEAFIQRYRKVLARLAEEGKKSEDA